MRENYIEAWIRKQIEELGGMPASEMAETRLFDALPEALTYPNITPHLFRWAAELGVI